MGSYSHRSVRVVPGPAHEHPSSPRSPSRSATGAYAALMKRGRPTRERTSSSTDNGLIDEESVALAAYRSALLGIDSGARHQSGGDDADDGMNQEAGSEFPAEQRALLAHLPRLADTLRIDGTQWDGEHGFAGKLAWRIAKFCGEPSVQSAGVWEASIPLAPDTVPDTVLHLSLSPYRLWLRFDTSNRHSMQLISLHSNALRERLAALLGPEREIEIA
ncbi:type III secretion system protein SctP [Paraburkholderia sp. CI3]|uniref:type III secretion system protein SctP n=1 Tax=Paraburkholderia sp. CI3 TaxID=2991060 RepID=UPI003D240E3F